jgi:hypothetical protein
LLVFSLSWAKWWKLRGLITATGHPALKSPHRLG